MRWDIFCRVIDNHGDAGVCWRLACDLAARGESVRLWIDDASALAWMAPAGAAGVAVREWRPDTAFPAPADNVVEAFGCELPPRFVQSMAGRSAAPCWINLEYLTAESYAQRAHGLPSPVMGAPGAGLTKHFFYPGFRSGTGGLLREPGLLARQSGFDRAGWLRSMGVNARKGRVVSLFCYEPATLPTLLQQFQHGPEPTQLLVTAGRATAAVRAVGLPHPGAGLTGMDDERLTVTWLPLLTQADYDHLLWSCDFNFVRGEDSVVRALWAGRPFCWQVYPQDDGAHEGKLDAFLDWLDAPPDWRAFHRGWNGLQPGLPRLDPPAWLPVAQAARARLLAQDDLVTQLLRFVTARSGLQ
jgi:uncharacterized repeat protein (TIGR03837 family)